MGARGKGEGGAQGGGDTDNRDQGSGIEWRVRSTEGRVAQGGARAGRLLAW